MDHWDHIEQVALENSDNDGDFYKDAADYWSKIPPTVDGMLGGYGFISSIDINGSNQFLKQLFRLKVPPGKSRALDCGAGIGRVSKNLLFHHFEKVDLVEQNPAFVAQAQASLQSHNKMGDFYCSGLQDFTPEPAAYDVIWCQWVLSHLTDEDLIAFLHGCKKGLKKNGVIVLKENTTSSGILDKDTTDSSVTRPLDHICLLLQQSNLKCVKQKRQEKFPNGLYPVYMIATRPIQESNVQTEDITISDETEDNCRDTVDMYGKGILACEGPELALEHSNKMVHTGIAKDSDMTEVRPVQEGLKVSIVSEQDRMDSFSSVEVVKVGLGRVDTVCHTEEFNAGESDSAIIQNVKVQDEDEVFIGSLTVSDLVYVQDN